MNVSFQGLLASLALALYWHPAAATVQVNEIGCIAMTVRNLQKSVQFYEEVLDFQLVNQREGRDLEAHLFSLPKVHLKVARLSLGEECLELQELVSPRGRPFPKDSASNDRWFQHVAIIVSNMDDAFARLRAHDVTFGSNMPQVLPSWNEAAAGILAFYFRDPDAHYLEIHFPDGKGNPKWHEITGSSPFLGIDHSAIVVSNTEASVDYYCRQLGLHIAGTSENYGTEQEHLNNVFGARLRITSLRAAKGPGIDLLQYCYPPRGGPSRQTPGRTIFGIGSSICLETRSRGSDSDRPRCQSCQRCANGKRSALTLIATPSCCILNRPL